jgi:hypothetical protein
MLPFLCPIPCLIYAHPFSWCFHWCWFISPHPYALLQGVGSVLPSLGRNAIRSTLQSLRDGDRFYFENHWFSPEEEKEILGTGLRDIILRNKGI